MTVMTQIILAVALVLSIIVPFGYYLLGEKSRGRYKTAIGTNAFFFFGTMLVAAMVMFAGAVCQWHTFCTDRSGTETAGAKAEQSVDINNLRKEEI